MKSYLLMVLGLTVLPVQAGVENILSLQQDGNGTFSVLCENPSGKPVSAIGVTADNIRADIVCALVQPMNNAILEQGTYATQSQFCSQTLTWLGDDLKVTVNPPCAGELLLTAFEPGWYRGQMQGYDYMYELEVTSPTSYRFHSRSFAQSGEFVKQDQPQPVPARRTRRLGVDPAAQ